LPSRVPRRRGIGRFVHSDLVILDELGICRSVSQAVALLFRLLSKLYEHTSLIITTNLSFSDWVSLFGDETKGVKEKPET
jgi:DNA replication protein DnaC